MTTTELFLPAAVRREILQDYGNRYGLKVFIETGTNEGDTPWALKGSFRNLFTIELDEHLHAVAARRFARHRHVVCVQGDSATVLPKVLGMFKGPALVWLDGHYSGPGTAHGEISTPIREELTTLFADGRPHIILVDDARIFEGQPEHEMYDHYATYPSLEWIEELAHEHEYDYAMSDDIVRLTPRSI